MKVYRRCDQVRVLGLAVATVLTACGSSAAPVADGGAGGRRADARAPAGPVDARAPGGPDLYVSAMSGDDRNPGTQASPFRSITRAFAGAQPGTTIHVEPGTYDQANGEFFPMKTPRGITLTSTDGPKVTIIRSSVKSSNGYAVTLEPTGQTTVSGFTVQNDPTGAVMQIDIALEESGCKIVDNVIDVVPGTAPTAAIGIEINGVQEIVSGNTIRGMTTGIKDSGGLIRLDHNRLVANAVGIDIGPSGVDLGGGSQGSDGGNVLSCNTQADLVAHSAAGTVYAHDDAWDHVPPTTGASGGGVDIAAVGAAVDSAGATLAAGACP